MADPIDFLELARSRLASQFSQSPNIIAWLEGLSFESQELDDDLQDVLSLRSIDTAENAQLDTLGRIVRQERTIGTTTYDDTDYRKWIRARATRNYTRSTPEDVIQATQAILNVSQVFFSDGGAQITLGIGRDLTPEEIALLQSGLIPKTAGVEIDFFVYNAEAFYTYRSVTTGSTIPSGDGYGTVTAPLVGGEYASISL